MSTRAPAVLKKLKEIAPSIAISVGWEEDPHFVWDGEGAAPRERGYIPYNVDVIAEAVVDGRIVRGIQSLGGTYEKEGHRDPDIHGYLLQMAEEAIGELMGEFQPSEKAKTASVWKQAKAARTYLTKTLKLRYEEDREHYRRRKQKRA